jgi:hypothetical protein
MKRRIIFGFLLCLLFVAVFISPTPISEKVRAQGLFYGAQRWPAIDVDNNDNLYLMMSVATAPASEHRPHSQIFFTMSRDLGATWDNLPQTRNLSNSPGEAFGPSLAVNRNGKLRLYVSYQDNSSGFTRAMLITTKKKTKFRKPLELTSHNGGSFAPRVALDTSETVNIVWGDTRDGAGKVQFIRSTDLGLTFNDPIDVSRSAGSAFDPEIAIDSSDAINVAWEDTRTGNSSIMYSRSTDGGVTFSEPKKVSTGTGKATEVAIANDANGKISLAWVEDSIGHFEAYYSRSTDGGSTFSQPLKITDFPNGDIHKPAVITFKNTIYVAFQNGDLFGEEDLKNRQVFVTKSSNAGESFQEPDQVSSAINSKGRAHSPAMTVDSEGTLHIVWIDASVVGNDEGLLFYSKSTDGHRFTPEKMILAVL